MKPPITKQMRTRFRFALEDKGVPEDYAYLASRAVNIYYSNEELGCMRARDLLIGAFSWCATPQGYDFWIAVMDTLSEVE